MKVAFVPVWSANPYHSELKASLQSQGVEVLFPGSLRAAYLDHLSGAQKLDVVHLHALPYFGSSPASVGRYTMFFHRVRKFQKLGVKVVWTVHDFQNHDSAYWRIENFVSRRHAGRLDALIAHGPTAKRIIETQWGEPVGSRIQVIPHGNYIGAYKNGTSGAAARTALGLAPSNLVFLFLGLIRPYKGVEEMVKAFRACEGEDLRLVIAGRPVSDEIKVEVERSIQGDSRVKFFPGDVEADKIQVYANASDVMVLPYLRVFTSGVAILGMSFGKPCIAPRAGCVPDVMDEKGGALFDPAVSGDLERAFQKMIAARTQLAEMGRYNFDRAKGWDWQTIGRQTAALYEQCLNGSGTRS
jgi:beta-1,4-mannosyltransferase